MRFFAPLLVMGAVISATFARADDTVCFNRDVRPVLAEERTYHLPRPRRARPPRGPAL